MPAKMTFTGLKGGDRSIRLDRRNLITGPNGSGKTSVAQGFKILALGYDPALGKRPMDTAELMAADKLKITLELDDGRTMSRSIQKKDDGFETSAHASWIGKATATKHKAEIERLFGTTSEEVEECLDISTLLALSANKRSAKLEELKDENEEELYAAVLEIEKMIEKKPKIWIHDDAARTVSQGAKLAAPGVIAFNDFKEGDYVFFFKQSGEVIAVAKAQISSEEAQQINKGIIATPQRIIHIP